MSPHLSIQSKDVRLTVLVILLIGATFLAHHCASTVPPSQPLDTGTEPSSYPHEAGWNEAVSHGSFVVRHGLAQCMVCHSRVSAEATKVPDCSTCHPLYPHSREWTKKENHGAEVLKSGNNICATLCHGTDLNGGLSGISCAHCHSITPHTSNWANPEQHGIEAKGDGKNLCVWCHGEDFQGSDMAPSCFTCHPKYPHPSGWRERQGHGSFVATNGQDTCATTCHNFDLNGGLSGVACQSCHGLYNHPDNWIDEHSNTVAQIGKETCKLCHGLDFKTIFNRNNCFSCHPDYPHPSETVWLPFGGGHGSAVQVGYGGSFSSCQNCHGMDLKTMKAGRNCFSCHQSYPHQFVSSAQWQDFEGHGIYALTNTMTECKMCHGADYRGTTWNNVSCFSCHNSYPHLPGWVVPQVEIQAHWEYVSTNGTTSCATERCHGVNLVPTPGVTRGAACELCHGNQAPHPAGWNKGEIHGQFAIANIGGCKLCHGSELNQAPRGFRSCFECHPSYLGHASAQISTIAWDTWNGHGVFLQNSSWDKTECQNCHGSDFLGGLSGKSCKKAACHASYPHNLAGWNSTGHGSYIRTTLTNNKTQCLVCHGSGGTGGHSGISCPTCHANALHTDPNWGAGASGRTANAHATNFVAEFSTGNISVCTECHGTTYSALIGSTRCTNAGCHPAGITHRSGWSLGSGHGSAFSSSFRSSTFGASKCSHCHGLAAIFSAAQTKTALAAQSDCYKCHATYPHIGYAGVTGWKSRHTSYINGRPATFTNAQGQIPGAGANALLPAISFSCGGTEIGSCHYNTIPPSSQTRCSQYCHN